jgi:hypothetical protein
VQAEFPYRKAPTSRRAPNRKAPKKLRCPEIEKVQPDKKSDLKGHFNLVNLNSY